MARSMKNNIVSAIRAIPRGSVSSYGAIARAAGYPGAARQVAWILHASFGLPWQRIVGADGRIKLRGDSALEQRLRLESEGVTFRGRRVDMRRHEFRFSARQPRRSASLKKARPVRKKSSRRAR